MYQYFARSLRVLDGDTAVLSIDLGFGISIAQVVRLKGIDTPELRSGDRRDAAKQARDWLTEKLTGKTLEIRTMKDSGDKYGRILVEISIAGESSTVNDQLLSLGLAVLYDGGKKIG